MSGNPFRHSFQSSGNAEGIATADAFANDQEIQGQQAGSDDVIASVFSPETKNAGPYTPQPVPQTTLPARAASATRREPEAHSADSVPDSTGSESSDSDEASDDPFGTELDDETETVSVKVLKQTDMASSAVGNANSPSKMPFNPFQRTLATMEGHSASEEESITPRASAEQPKVAEGRVSLDVDSFKRLLMTGSVTLSTSGLSGSTPAQQRPPFIAAADSSSSTDASSISRHSIFDRPQDYSTESPRTSYELAVSDDEHSALVQEVRKMKEQRPPLPKHRHGKLVSPRSNAMASSADLHSPISPEKRRNNQAAPVSRPKSGILRTPSNLNKPLPPPPPASSSTERESQTETGFPEHSEDQLILETPSTPPSRRRTAPPPPITRRHSQRPSSGSQRSRSDSSLTVNSVLEDITEQQGAQSSENPTSTHKTPPPPPRTRRPASITKSSLSSSITSSLQNLGKDGGSDALDPMDPKTSVPEAGPLPARAASVKSTHRASPNAETKGMPPPPPPRRRASGRSSSELSRPESTSSGASIYQIEDHERSGDEPHARDFYTISSPVVSEGQPSGVAEASSSSQSHDLLAGIAALQKEVDALRDKYRQNG